MAAIRHNSVDSLSSQNATQRLYRNFVRQEQDGSIQEYASSHWDHYRSFFKFKANDAGELESVDGVGFGSCKWRSNAHRILDNLCVLTHFLYLPNRTELFSVFLKAYRIVRKIGLSPTVDVFRQACTQWLLSKYIERFQKKSPIQLIVIGDGYGVFSSLFKHFYPDSGITLVDLPETLMVQSINCQMAFPDEKHTVVESVMRGDTTGFNYCTPNHIDFLRSYRFHIAVNVASLQEMSNEMIGSYFDLLRTALHRSNLFYCCNREKKVLPDGEITQIHQYPWMAEDKILLNELCPWYRYFFGRYPTRNGLKVGDWRVPFVNYYDGPIWHKMVRMKTKPCADNYRLRIKMQA